MNRAEEPSDRINPFATRFTRPGGIAYRFPPGVTAELLVDRLQAADWRGQIVGPHGSGKSTLLAALVPVIQRRGRQVLLIELHDGQRDLPRNWSRGLDPGRPGVVIVDGCEQLAPWNRLLLRWFCRRRGLGLLVTGHRRLGLPELVRTTVDLELACQIVQSLVGQHGPLLGPEELRRRLAARGGNLREVLFDLYDLYEEWQSDPGERGAEAGHSPRPA